MAKELWSIFTDDMNKCLITNIKHDIERHHIFGGMQGLRKKSEEFGFVVPIHKSLHPNGAFLSSDKWVDLDHWFKRKCQEYYLEVACLGTRDDWYKIFGRFYDDRADENVMPEWEWNVKGVKNG